MPNINIAIDIVSIVRANTISIFVRKKRPIEVLIISDRTMTVARLLHILLSINSKITIEIIVSASNEISIPNIRYNKIFIIILLMAQIEAQIPNFLINFSSWCLSRTPLFSFVFYCYNNISKFSCTFSCVLL